MVFVQLKAIYCWGQQISGKKKGLIKSSEPVGFSLKYEKYLTAKPGSADSIEREVACNITES